MSKIKTLPDEVAQHIEHLECVRSDFIANVSHELRTPLTVIRGYLETLIEKERISKEMIAPILKQMYQHSLRMEHIIEDLLLLSRLENTEKETVYQQNLSICTLLESIYEDAKQISQGQHHITLHSDPHIQIDGIEEELKSVFYNLISNAIKYTPVGGKIALHWGIEDHCACFSVCDNGIGIDKAHIPRLTERFYRVDKARSRNSGGTGLGLAITKHVLIRHHGKLMIESQPGKGSRFTCLFSEEMTHVV